MTPVLQMPLLPGLGGLVLALGLSVLLVAFGTYVGVLMALQSFFGGSTWAERSRGDPDGRAEADPGGRPADDQHGGAGDDQDS